MHHFQYQHSSQQQAMENEISPQAHFFQCTGPECSYRMKIEVKPPRFNALKWNDLCVSPSRLQARLIAAQSTDPGNSRDYKQARPIDTYYYLYRYICDVISPPVRKDRGPPDRIPCGNKKFSTTFGSDFDELFQDLGFRKVLYGCCYTRLLLT
jgi:hypothetical protein